MVDHIQRKKGRGKSKASQDLIEWAIQWFAENHPASIRAACYKLFVAGYTRSMSKGETNKVSVLLRKAREEGLLPWEHVVDETREAERINTWANPDQVIKAAVDQYRRDYWQDQPRRVEVWSEKGTIRGTLAPVLDRFGVTFRVMHGYGSATALNTIARETLTSERPMHVLYLGDFDPSGLHMSVVDIPARLARYGGKAIFQRIALTDDDVSAGTDLPHFDAATKIGDGRHRWFVTNYGTKCWELDAMAPGVLRKRVERHIIDLLDVAAWDRSVAVEEAETASMREFFHDWKGISGQASKYSEGSNHG